MHIRVADFTVYAVLSPALADELGLFFWDKLPLEMGFKLSIFLLPIFKLGRPPCLSYKF